MNKPNASNQGAYDEVVLAVATGEPIARFCERSGVSRSTVSRWQRSPDFLRDVDRQRRKIVDGAVGRLHAGAEAAAVAMVKLAIGAQAESTKLQASKAVLEHLMSLTEFADLKARVSGIEKQLEGLAGGHQPASSA